MPVPISDNSPVADSEGVKRFCLNPSETKLFHFHEDIKEK